MRLLFTFFLLFIVRLLSAQCNPPVIIDPIPRLCSGDLTYQLSATPAGGVWSGPHISPGGLIALPGLNGTYKATYIFSDSSCTDTVQASFQVISGPPLSAGTDFSIVCGGTPRVNGAYIPGPNRYAFWSTPDGQLLDPPTDLNGRVGEPGTYILTAIDTTIGCPSRDTSVCFPYLPSFPNTVIVDTICQGDTLLGYTTSGNFYTKYETGAPCDSFRVVRLTVLKPLRDTLTTVICSGGSIDGYTQSGTYIDTLSAISGCDSIRTLALTVLPVSGNHIQFSTCDPAEAGVFSVVLQAANGCDSTVTTTVTVLPAAASQIEQTICAGQSFEGYTQSGIYTDTYTAANGCDSVRTLALTVLPVFDTHLQFSTCDPAQAGVFSTVFQAANGCDSTVTTTVTLLPGAASQIEQTICAGQSFEGYTQSGIYTDTYTAANGCDSVRTLALTVLPVFDTQIQLSTCDPAQAGVFSVVLQAANGCDSTVTTVIALLPTDTVLIFDTSCDPANVGVFVQILTNQNGCDSTVTITVTLLPGAASQIEQTICAGQSFEGYTQSGVYNDTFQAANGCDSIRTLLLTVQQLPAATADIEADHGSADGAIELVSLGGIPSFQLIWSTGDSTASLTGLAAGDYILTLTDATGCSAVLTFTVPLMVGASDPGEPALHLSAAPNPQQAGQPVLIHLNTPGSGDCQVAVFTATGRLLRRFTREHNGDQTVFPLEFPMAGVYIIQVADEMGRSGVLRVVVW